MKSEFEENIINSWNQNAKAWIGAIEKNEIESRVTTTNKVIIDTIIEKEPNKVLDVGCGEGWLSRALNSKGINVLGIDAISSLVEEARSKGGGRFEVLTYQEVSIHSLKEKFDVIVCNFSLIGKESVDNLFENIHEVLNEDGFFIIQTLHPLANYIGYHYEDGWRKGSWTGFSDQFTNPPPWYFRTLETWKKIFRENGLYLSEIIETKKQSTEEKMSIVFVGKVMKK